MPGYWATYCIAIFSETQAFFPEGLTRIGRRDFKNSTQIFKTETHSVVLLGLLISSVALSITQNFPVVGYFERKEYQQILSNIIKDATKHISLD